jgi:hypothetical protein
VRYLTAGERMCNRPLTAERRGGVPHYVPGQHHAEITDPAQLREVGVEDGDTHPAAMVTYVDQAGEAVAVLCMKTDDGWEAVMVGRSGHQVMRGWRPVGADGFKFLLSDKMLAALRRAERKMRL